MSSARVSWREAWEILRWNLWEGIRPYKRWAVVTKVDKDDYADEILEEKEFVTGWGPNGDLKENLFYLPIGEYSPTVRTLRVKLPVFEHGEILLLNRIGREISGRGRKPSKWNTKCAYFYTLRSALRCHQRARQEEYQKHDAEVATELAEYGKEIN